MHKAAQAPQAQVLAFAHLSRQLANHAFALRLHAPAGAWPGIAAAAAAAGAVGAAALAAAAGRAAAPAAACAGAACCAAAWFCVRAPFKPLFKPGSAHMRPAVLTPQPGSARALVESCLGQKAASTSCAAAAARKAVRSALLQPCREMRWAAWRANSPTTKHTPRALPATARHRGAQRGRDAFRFPCRDMGRSREPRATNCTGSTL